MATVLGVCWSSGHLPKCFYISQQNNLTHWCAGLHKVILCPSVNSTGHLSRPRNTSLIKTTSSPTPNMRYACLLLIEGYNLIRTMWMCIYMGIFVESLINSGWCVNVIITVILQMIKCRVAIMPIIKRIYLWHFANLKIWKLYQYLHIPDDISMVIL